VKFSQIMLRSLSYTPHHETHPLFLPPQAKSRTALVGRYRSGLLSMLRRWGFLWGRR